VVELVGLKGREQHSRASCLGRPATRVGIARSLAVEPDAGSSTTVLRLGSPDPARDAGRVLRLQNLLRKTIVFITMISMNHPVADRIAIMKDGEIIRSARRKTWSRGPATVTWRSSRAMSSGKGHPRRRLCGPVATARRTRRASGSVTGPELCGSDVASRAALRLGRRGGRLIGEIQRDVVIRPAGRTQATCGGGHNRRRAASRAAPLVGSLGVVP